MFESGKRREDATNRVERTAAQHGIGHSRHDVLHVVLANDADLAPMTNLLPYPSNRRHDPVAFEVGSSRQISADRRCSRKPQAFRKDPHPQRGHTVIVKVKQGEIGRGLIFENPLFSRDVFIQRLITVLMIDRHIEQGGDPGMELIDRFQLETRDLHDEIVVWARLPCLAGAEVFHRRLAQGGAQISADKRPLAALGEKLADEGHGRALAVGTSDGKKWASEEPRSEL